MAMLDDMKADTSLILETWGESLSITRPSNTYTMGMASQSWASQGVITGDWQNLSGAERRQEQGRDVQSDAKVICCVDADVQEGDRCYNTDGDYMYVNYIQKYEDHWSVFLTKAEPK